MKGSDRIAVLIAAAGSGSRMGTDRPKQYIEIEGRTILERTIDVFQDHFAVDEIWVAVPPPDVSSWKKILKPAAKTDKIRGVLPGGSTRQETIRLSLATIALFPPDYILIQDAARPFTSPALIDRVVEGMRETGAAVPGLAPVDTIKRRTAENLVSETLDRSSLSGVQTPQGFRFDWIQAAHNEAVDAGRSGTDDSALVEAAGYPVRIVSGERQNFKITTVEDLAGLSSPVRRVGIGHDTHKLIAGRALWLGGVKIDFPQGLSGHSDADVVIHAIIDALLGAAGLGDIGRCFPDSDPAYKDISSLKLLSQTAKIIEEAGWRIENVDVTVIGEKPKIRPHAEEMRQRCAEALGVSRTAVNIKGTTTEGLGYCGRGEGLSAVATAGLISRQTLP